MRGDEFARRIHELTKKAIAEAGAEIDKAFDEWFAALASPAPMPETEVEQVTQGDRDAAEAWFESVGEVLASCFHGDSLAEAFAAHRRAGLGSAKESGK